MKTKIAINALLILVIASCASVETNRAAPNMSKLIKHRRMAIVMTPELAAAREREENAVTEYYAAIDSLDEKRFLAAKAELAAAVQAVEKLVGGAHGLE